ncbi:Pseudouridine synthase [Pseudomonas amygdali pv. eriobotryae]|uniref:Pseudouridine synthase n=1 Tax=Pseudomonas amygdali pv. eriobotryae TaxID=129137 RepID=A0A3M3ANQ9_PSEA0|nr:Pseudouridine synthase [Pseudomonas amygdali pv. eriobotryae]RMT81405.1 Pseudouridine synthase [Pseudomonas savastanoi pv. nerii]
MSENIELRAEVPSELGGQRLDQVAAQLFAEHSRSRLSAWIKDGRLTVDGGVLRPRDIVHGGAVLELIAEQEAQGEWVAQDIELDIIYEDDQILVINKPAGLVVHPAAGHADGTLLNALLHHVPDIINVPRAGIVHRLDKDTTGLMVVAKTIQAQTQLVTQLQSRSVSRIYECIVIGVVTAGGKIDAPIGRHGQQRQRMAGEIIEIAGAFRKTAGIPMPPKVRHNHPIPAGQRVDLRTPHRLVPKVTVTEQDNRPGALVSVVKGLTVDE